MPHTSYLTWLILRIAAVEGRLSTPDHNSQRFPGIAEYTELVHVRSSSAPTGTASNWPS